MRQLTQAEITADKIERQARKLLLLADELRASAPKRVRRKTKMTAADMVAAALGGARR